MTQGRKDVFGDWIVVYCVAIGASDEGVGVVEKSVS